MESSQEVSPSGVGLGSPVGAVDFGVGIVSTGGRRRDRAPRGVVSRGVVLRGGGGEAPFAMNAGVPRCARCARRRRGVSRRRSLPSSFAERRWRRRFEAELWGLGEG